MNELVLTPEISNSPNSVTANDPWKAERSLGSHEVRTQAPLDKSDSWKRVSAEPPKQDLPGNAKGYHTEVSESKGYLDMLTPILSGGKEVDLHIHMDKNSVKADLKEVDGKETRTAHAEITNSSATLEMKTPEGKVTIVAGPDKNVEALRFEDEESSSSEYLDSQGRWSQSSTHYKNGSMDVRSYENGKLKGILIKDMNGVEVQVAFDKDGKGFLYGKLLTQPFQAHFGSDNIEVFNFDKDGTLKSIDTFGKDHNSKLTYSDGRPLVATSKFKESKGFMTFADNGALETWGFLDNGKMTYLQFKDGRLVDAGQQKQPIDR